VLVVGHTDNVPIRTARFPSNWALSQARADAVQRVLAEAVADPGRLTVEGRADTQPIASNADDAGRARNRRVEILLLK
jgi:type VI secretion system protein ImpK